jgi:hypothetical protein
MTIPITVSERLLKLERENRRMKRVAVTASLVVMCTLIMGQAQSVRTVEAERFVLRDSGGRVRANLAMLPGDLGPSLSLYDADGKVIWSAPPIADESSATPAKSGPRVFLEVWSSGGVGRAERKTEPLDQETQLLTQTCPGVLVTVEPQNSDFILRLTHHLSGVDLLRPDNPPPDYYRDFYQWSLIRHDGTVVQTGSGESLPGAIKQACDILAKH